MTRAFLVVFSWAKFSPFLCPCLVWRARRTWRPTPSVCHSFGMVGQLKLINWGDFWNLVICSLDCHLCQKRCRYQWHLYFKLLDQIAFSKSLIILGRSQPLTTLTSNALQLEVRDQIRTFVKYLGLVQEY